MSKPPSKLDAEQAEFHATIVEYYNTGNLSPEIFNHLKKIEKYTRNLPNFRGYGFLDEMIQRGADKAIDAIVKKKFDIKKKKPVSFFAQIYYNQCISFLRLYKTQVKLEERLTDLNDALDQDQEVLPHDPISLLSPMIAWIVEGEGKERGKRFEVFIQMHYPELTNIDKRIDERVMNNYLTIFPSSIINGGKVRKIMQKRNIINLMKEINQMRKLCNTQSDLRDEGLRNNLIGLRNIIDKRLKPYND